MNLDVKALLKDPEKIDDDILEGFITVMKHPNMFGVDSLDVFKFILMNIFYAGQLDVIRRAEHQNGGKHNESTE